ncbi:MAG: putative zinc-binding protein [Candidatus Methanomethylicaceae archaeon]|jgi:uncharacterized metal-binding protein
MAKQKPSVWQFPNKIVVAPCGGIGQTAGTISRQAAYEVVEKLMPKEAVLLCLPAFNIDVEEDMEMVRQNPSRVVVIEGCANFCMTKLLELKGCKPAKTVFIPKIVSKMGITVEKSKNRATLTALEKKVVSVVAAKTVAAAKSLKV